MTELEKDINNLRSGLKSVESVSHADLRRKSRNVPGPLLRLCITLRARCLQELDYQKKRPQELGDKFVSVVSQFITVASFSFSDVEDSLSEAKELVSPRRRCGLFEPSGRHRSRWQTQRAKAAFSFPLHSCFYTLL